MKRILTLLLRLFVLFLLILFIYQRLTGSALDGISARRKVDALSIKLKDNISRLQSGTLFTKKAIENSEVKGIAIISGSAADVQKVKRDIMRNKSFLSNLREVTKEYKLSVGKGDVFAQWVVSNDKKHDAVSITISGNTLRFPAKYNADNSFALDNNFIDKVYYNSGIQLLQTNGGHTIFYKATSNNDSIGVLQNIEQTTSVSMDGLIPLLYYKNRYLFSLQNDYGLQSLFVLQDSNELETLGGWSIDAMAIDANVFAFRDAKQGNVYFLSLDSLKIIKTIPIAKGSSFEGFVFMNGFVRIEVKDNIKNVIRYEKRNWVNT